MKDSTISNDSAQRGLIGAWRPTRSKRRHERGVLTGSRAGARKMSLWLAGLGVALAWTSGASAQGKVVTIAEVTIVGRIQKPIAAVDVSRIQPQMTLAQLRQPFLDRIEKAVYRAPF